MKHPKIIQIESAVIDRIDIIEGRPVTVGQVVQIIGLSKDGNTYTWSFETGEWNLNKMTESQKAERDALLANPQPEPPKAVVKRKRSSK